jgi:hypothetical protein
MSSALAWGALAASSLILGAVIGLTRTLPDRLVGAVLGFGVGVVMFVVLAVATLIPLVLWLRAVPAPTREEERP